MNNFAKELRNDQREKAKQLASRRSNIICEFCRNNRTECDEQRDALLAAAKKSKATLYVLRTNTDVKDKFPFYAEECGKRFDELRAAIAQAEQSKTGEKP